MYDHAAKSGERVFVDLAQNKAMSIKPKSTMVGYTHIVELTMEALI